LWAESTYSNVSIKAGLGNTISEKEPTNYTTGNFEIHYIHNVNIVALQFKYFNKNPDIITTEISNEITGKNFYIVSIKYGRPLFMYKNANLNAFCGLGFYDHRIYKNLGMSLSAFSDLNLTEIIGGLILNLKIDLKL
jgi:hypothetical protein